MSASPLRGFGLPARRPRLLGAFLVLLAACCCGASRAQTILSVTFSPSSTVQGGAPASALVTLSSPAFLDTPISLTSTNPAAAAVPSGAVIPAGLTTASLSLATSVVAVTQSTTIAATLNGASKSAVLTVKPGLAQVILDSQDTYVQGGASANSDLSAAPVLAIRYGGADNSQYNDAILLFFDLRGIGTPPDTAVLRLNAVSPTGPAGSLLEFSAYDYPVDHANGYTFNQLFPPRPPNPLFQVGGHPAATVTPALVNGVVTLDVSSMVRAEFGNLTGVVLIPDYYQGMNEFVFASREAVGGGPKLVLTWKNGFTETPVPGWAEGTVPVDTIASRGAGIDGIGPSEANGVNTTSGSFEHRPEADVLVHNAAGPDVAYARRYRSALSIWGQSAPGLPAGWTDNWDYLIRGASGSWSSMALQWPNRGADALTPVLSNGVPTGVLKPGTGAPFSVTGVPSSTAGRWSSITVQFKDLTRVTFLPSAASADRYLIASVTDIAGHTATLARNSDGTISGISGERGPLLAMTYSGGLLTNVADVSVPGQTRSVDYAYASIAGAGTVLSRVSQIHGAAAGGTRWSYGYTVAYGRALLNRTASPNAAGIDLMTASVTYDGAGRAAFMQDAVGNRRSYFYSGTTCRIDARTPAQPPVWPNVATQTWYQLSNGGRDTGVQSYDGYATGIGYDSVNAFHPRLFVNRNQQSSTITYDAGAAVGNVATLNVPCNGSTRTTTNTWDYSLSPTGLLASTQEGARTATRLTYYDGTTPVNGIVQAKGLVKAVATPMPGTIGSGQTVTTTYAYTALGDVVTATVPAPAPTGTVTYTLAYTGLMADGTTRTAEVTNEPVTLTDPLGHVTTYAWDAFGNMTARRDADGNTWTWTYAPPFDATHQVTRADFPPTNTGSSSPAAYETFAYLYPGGPVTGVSLFANTTDAVPFRTVGKGADREDELVQLLGDARPMLVTQRDGMNHALYTVMAGLATAYTTVDRNGNAINQGSFGGAAQINQQFSYDHDGQVTGIVNEQQFHLGRANGASGDNRITDFQNANYNTVYTFTYDAFGRVAKIAPGNTTATYAYDDTNRIVSHGAGYVGGSVVVSYGYNADGSRDSMTTPAGTYAYDYDAAGRMTALHTPWGDVISYTWSPGGRLLTQQTGLGATQYGWSPSGHLASIANTSATADAVGNTLLSRFTGITWDAAGNLAGSSELIPAVTVTGGSHSAGVSGPVVYTYDNLDRLVREDASGRSTTGVAGNNALGVTYAYPYVYNTLDSPTSLRAGPNGITAAYNAIGELTSISGAGISASNSSDYAGGSLGAYTDSVLKVQWGSDGQPFDVTSSAWQASWAELANGLRDWVSYYPATPTEYYVFDGRVPVAVIGSGGSLTSAFAYGPAGLVERYPGSGTNYYWYTFDPCGNTVERTSVANSTNHSGKIADWVTRYDAYGTQLGCVDPATQTEATATNQDMAGFAGQYGAYTDQGTAAVPAVTGYRDPLVRMIYREYEPLTGRFLSALPVSEGVAFNAFTYAADNPTSGAADDGLHGRARHEPGDWKLPSGDTVAAWFALKYDAYYFYTPPEGWFAGVFDGTTPRGTWDSIQFTPLDAPHVFGQPLGRTTETAPGTGLRLPYADLFTNQHR